MEHQDLLEGLGGVRGDPCTWIDSLRFLGIQLIFEQLCSRDPFSILDGHHSFKQDLDLVGDLDIDRELEQGIVDQIDELWDGALLKWAEPVQHLIENDPEGPDIRPVVVYRPLQYFWSHVNGRAHHGLGHLVFEHFLAEPKIGYLDDPVMEQNVVGLEIPVQDLFFVEQLEGRPELVKYLEGVILRQSFFDLDIVAQSAPIAVLVDQVVVVGGPQHLIEPDDVGMADLGQNIDLVVGKFAELGGVLELLHAHHLDCEELASGAMFGSVNVAVLAFPDAFHQHIILYHFIHSQCQQAGRAQTQIYIIFVTFEMASEQAVALWKTQLTLYKRIFERVKEEVMTPLTRFPPPAYEEKQANLKEQLEIGEVENYEEFLDVIVEHVEGVPNKSIIELADQLCTQLGGSLKYWQNVVLDVGQYINYGNIVSIWQVRKVFEHHLYADAQHLNDYRLFMKLAKQYMSALSNLIKFITKFDDKKDCVSRIDELYKRVKSAQSKYVSYSSHCSAMSLNKSATIEELSNNVSNFSKKNAMKDLFNFAEPKRPKNQKSKNTLLNYKFTMGRMANERVQEPTKNIKITDNILERDRLATFESYFTNLSANRVPFEELRKQFQTNLQLPKSCHSINLVTIWDRDYYFTYQGYPVEVPVHLNFLKPVEPYPNINYDICSEDQYQELLGEDVENYSEFSSASQLSHPGSFIVSDDHLSDDEEVNKENNQPKLKANYDIFGSRWSFSRLDSSQFYRNKVEQFRMVPVCRTESFPLPLIVPTVNQDDILGEIVNGKDRKQIQQAVDRFYMVEKIKITKAKIDMFLKKKCVKSKSESNPVKIVYLLSEPEDRTNKQSSQDDPKSKRSEYTITIQSPHNLSQKIMVKENHEPETDEQKPPQLSNNRNQDKKSKPIDYIHVEEEDEQGQEDTRKSKKPSPRRTRSRSRRSRSQSQQKTIVE